MCLALPTVAPPQWPADGKMPPAPTRGKERPPTSIGLLPANHALWWPNGATTQRLCPIACCWQHQAHHTERHYSVCSHCWVGLKPRQPGGCRSVAAWGPCELGFAQGSAVCGVSLVEQAPSPSSPKPLPLGSKPTHCVSLLPERLCLPSKQPAEESSISWGTSCSREVARHGFTDEWNEGDEQRLSTDEGSRFLFLTKIVLTDGKNFFRNNLVSSF